MLFYQFDCTTTTKQLIRVITIPFIKVIPKGKIAEEKRGAETCPTYGFQFFLYALFDIHVWREFSGHIIEILGQDKGTTLHHSVTSPKFSLQKLLLSFCQKGIKWEQPRKMKES
jgi:hypothetical protein